MTNIFQNFIESRLIEIRDEYDALEVKPMPCPKSLIKFLALADTVACAYVPEDIENEIDNEIKSLTPDNRQAQTIKRVCDDLVASEDLSATIDGINAEPDVPEGTCHVCGHRLTPRGRDGYECTNCHGYTE